MGRLIDADWLKAQWEEPTDWMDGDQVLHHYTWFKIMLELAPTVEAVPVVTGTWKAVTDDGENYKRICTCCGNEAPFDELEGVYLIYPHCPWCGADMWKDGEQHEG